MCGRFALSPITNNIEMLRPSIHDRIAPRYNIAPGGAIAAVINSAPDALSYPVWGFLPSWNKGDGRMKPIINARGESLLEKPAFRNSFRYRRCIIPATGFYEWQKQGRSAMPFLARVLSAELFALGGIWNITRGPDENDTMSTAIITTPPNDLMKHIHDRMPLIIPKSRIDLWLSPDDAHIDEIASLIAPYPVGDMTAYAVSSAVNSPSFDHPSCFEPASLF